jgi:predicted metalloprotease with PDZ domain
MLDDILPHMGRKTAADISLEIPPGLAAAATVQPGGAEKLFVGDVEKAVVFLAADCRQRRIGTNGSLILLNLSGDWLFSDDEAAAMASEIVSAYGRLFGSVPAGEIDVNIRKFPDPVAVGNWEADTRGRTVTIVSSDMPFKSQSAQRLHEQLRHEIFHLWFPNGVNLSGNYDWFYEGFALYRSLKMGVGGNRLRFDDYLESLSQAYNLDAIQIDRYSLIDASARRWAGGNSTVYARGMLAAFLCDLAMLRASKGRSSVDDLLREVFQRGSSATRADGNETVLAAMRAHPELGPIIDKYVLSKAKIDWRAELLSAGITPGDDPSFARLAVVPAPNGRQRDLLDKLGYNNWRKLTKSSK